MYCSGKIRAIDRRCLWLKKNNIFFVPYLTQADLLFYHVSLHCYVVVELKTEKFKPEFAGKLNFYVTAVNKQMKTEQDNPTIGILICKDKDDVVAEYALDDISQPIGIAEYELTKVLREEFKSSLPTVEEIENELSE